MNKSTQHIKEDSVILYWIISMNIVHGDKQDIYNEIKAYINDPDFVQPSTYDDISFIVVSVIVLVFMPYIWDMLGIHRRL